MALPIDFSYHKFEPTEGIKSTLEELVQRLEKHEDDIISGRVVVDGDQKHGHKTIVEVAVELTVPGDVIVAKRQAEFPAPAGQQSRLDKVAADAFKVAEQQLVQHMAKMRPRDTKVHETGQAMGRVVRLNERVRNGFIEMPDGPELFFAETVLDGEFDDLGEGDEVKVTIAPGEGPYGPQASYVRPVAPMTRAKQQ